MTRWPRVLLLALALLASPALADPAQQTAPLRAVSLAGADATVAVAWVPGETPADAYRVYGLNPGGSPVLLWEEPLGTSANVPAGFSEYAVSGVLAGVESPLVTAQAIEGTCYGFVQVYLFPEPGVAVCKFGPLAKFRSLP